MLLRKCLAAGAVLGALCAHPAQAAVTKEDLLAATRALGFLERPLKGNVRVGIIYTPGGASNAEASQLQKVMQDLRVGNVTLVPQLVPLADIANANVDVLFLLSGLGTAAADVATTSKSKRIPCITTDLVQVQSGACLLGVESQPKVKIVVNRAAAEASGIRFASVFRMMITEL